MACRAAPADPDRGARGRSQRESGSCPATISQSTDRRRHCQTSCLESGFHWKAATGDQVSSSSFVVSRHLLGCSAREGRAARLGCPWYKALAPDFEAATMTGPLVLEDAQDPVLWSCDE